MVVSAVVDLFRGLAQNHADLVLHGSAVAGRAQPQQPL